MYTNPIPNLTPQCRARKYGQTDKTDKQINGQTDGRTGRPKLHAPELSICAHEKKCDEKK